MSEITDRACTLHREIIVFDGHYDRVYASVDDALADEDAIHQAGITCYIRQSFVADVLPFYERTNATVEAHPDKFLLATKAEHIREAHRSRRIATVLSIEGAEPLNASIEMMRLFYRLGMRNMGITWNNRNAAADGMGDLHGGGGLTSFGVRIVEEAARLGIMVDIAHLAPAGVRDVFAVYTGPVIASHANTRALCDHPAGRAGGAFQQGTSGVSHSR